MEVKGLASFLYQTLLGLEGKTWPAPCFQVTVALTKACTSYRLSLTRAAYNYSRVKKKKKRIELNSPFYFS